MAREKMVAKAMKNTYTYGKMIRIIMEKSKAIFEEKIVACKEAGFHFKQKRIAYKCWDGTKDYTAVMART